MAVEDIVILNLSLRIGGEDVLDDISCRFKPKTMGVFYGPKGAGKSVFLKSLNHIIEYNSDAELYGKFLFGEENYFHLDSDKIRQKVGLIFPEPRLISYLSIQDNIFLGCRLQNLPCPDHLGLFLDEIGLGSLTEDLTKQGSSCQLFEQFQVALARALILKPTVLCVDEPKMLSNEDRSRYFNILSKLKDKVTIICAMRRPEFVDSLWDYKAHFKKGTLQDFNAC